MGAHSDLNSTPGQVEALAVRGGTSPPRYGSVRRVEARAWPAPQHAHSVHQIVEKATFQSFPSLSVAEVVKDHQHEWQGFHRNAAYPVTLRAGSDIVEGDGSAPRPSA